MAADSERKAFRQVTTDQRADVGAGGGELRKGVNVLNTSDPGNPAPNPFVQAQNHSQAQNNNGGQNQPSNSNGSGKGKQSQ